VSGGAFRRGNLFRLGGLVKSTLDHLGLSRQLLERQALTKWAQVVGPHNAAASAPENIRDGVMFVACKNSMWANELSLHKERIIGRLNKALGGNVVKDIRFSARGFKRAKEAIAKEAFAGESNSLEAIQLPESEAKKAREVASASPSAELAELIEKAVLTSKRRAELKKQDEGHKANESRG